MKRRLYFQFIGILTVAFLLSMTLESNAQCCRWGANAGAGAGVGLFCTNIPGLTDNQLEQIDGLQTDYWKDMQKKRETLQEKRQLLNQLKAEENVKLKKVNQVIDEVNALEADMAKRQGKYRGDIRQLLDEKQKEYFDNLQTQRATFRANRPGRGLGPCGRVGALNR